MDSSQTNLVEKTWITRRWFEGNSPQWNHSDEKVCQKYDEIAMLIFGQARRLL